MVQLIVGKKGKGKTKQLLDKVNAEVKEISGSIVYLDKSTKHMFELNNKVRLIDVREFMVENSSEFLGFIPQPCSACLADSMESQEEFNDMMSGLPTPAKDSAEGVLKEAENVFGGNVDEPVLEGHSE